MATRKQRRRREKEQRHEYVWEDAEGNEIDPAELRTHANGAGDRSSKPSTSRGRGADGGRGAGRQVQPPSWPRTFKRALIFAPIFLATVMLLNRGLTFAGALLNTVFLLAVFVPFSYLIDRVMYRTFQKRQERSGGPAAPGKR